MIAYVKRSMTALIRYRRTTMRLREKFREEPFSKTELEDAIFIEIGTDKRTVKSATENMLRLKLIEKVENEREFGKPYTEKFKLPHSQNEYF